MKKKTLVSLSFCLAMMMLYSTFAFAAVPGSGDINISHDGTSKYSYYTSDYVEQKSDRYLKCTYARSSNPMTAQPAIYTNGSYNLLTDTVPFKTGNYFILATQSYVRRVHIYLRNSYQGISTTSNGTWRLYKSL